MTASQQTPPPVVSVCGYWSAEFLRDPRPRLVRPDAVLEIARPNGDGARVLFIEFDRTRRATRTTRSSGAM
jgi:hypothetical protein